ncbi:MAG: MarC family protein [Candidatus Micrarchaeota archaeon]|nr:MarC family protein [Candidatus Micrarchaeota archaeon]
MQGTQARERIKAKPGLFRAIPMDLNAISIITAFIALFVVMDPFSSVPVFLTLTKAFAQEKRREAAGVAALVAAGVFIGFLTLGPMALSFMGIRLESFEIGGGILMLLIAISFALGIEYGDKDKTSVEAVIIGVPMLSGPGTMLTAVLLATSLGFFNVLVAGIACCCITYLILLFSSKVYKLIGKNGLEILSRVAGVLLAAFAVEYIRKGLGL